MSEKVSYIIDCLEAGREYWVTKIWRGKVYRFVLDQMTLANERILPMSHETLARDVHRYSHSIRPLMRHEIPLCLL